MATKTDQIRLRVATPDKARWSECASCSGESLSSWLCRLADEEVARFNAEEGEAEVKRAERRLTKKAMYPQKSLLESGKKNYEPDWRH